MRKWGLIITTCYALVVLLLLVPGAIYIAGGDLSDFVEFYDDLFDPGVFIDDEGWIGWLVIAALVALQAILFFVSVDTSFRRLKPRTHVTLSVATVAFAVGLMCFAILVCIALAVQGDDFLEEEYIWIVGPIGLWGIWAAVFYAYRKQLSERLDRVVGWLLNGSVLQLLVAVPCHLIVRHRDECSAPLVTGFGIATGIALMLTAFGPSVYFLYQKKLGEYGYEARPAPLLGRRPVGAVIVTLAVAGLSLFSLLPGEDSDTHWGRVDNVAATDAEIVAAFEAHGNLLEMEVLRARERFWVMLCEGHVVANLSSYEDRDSGTLRWSYRTFSEPFLFWSDYMSFAESIREVLASLGDASFEYVNDRPFGDRFRVRLWEGTLFGRGCGWSGS